MRDQETSLVAWLVSRFFKHLFSLDFIRDFPSAILYIGVKMKLHGSGAKRKIAKILKFLWKERGVNENHKW